jgi:hypothetical protein
MTNKDKANERDNDKYNIGEDNKHKDKQKDTQRNVS